MRSWTARSAVTLNVNDRDHQVEVEPGALLLDVLREQLGLTGARRGCETGYCGACTVHLDGRPARSCLQLALRARGHRVTTIEGLGSEGALHPVQRAFLEQAAMECGYCVPGMIMLASGYLAEHPSPTEDEVRRALASNLCRCTGYRKMVSAVLAAAESVP
jgi:carbon-monoxide dehydrogenase small subunit